MTAPGYDADILILSLDRTADTLAAIASALAQTGVTRRVIVVDQGSRAENLRRLRRAVADCADVILACLPDNLGVAGGRNHAAGLGQGRIIIGLDNDAVFASDRTVAQAVAALDSDRTLAAVGLRILTYTDNTDDLASWGYPAALLPRAGLCFDAVTFVGAGHAIRRSAWNDVGGYDSRLFFCWEEYNFCLRAIAQGWRIRYRGDIAVRHKVAAEARENWSDRRWFFFVRNRLYIARKHGAAWWALLPRIVGYVLRGLRNGLGAVTLRAIAAAIRMQAEMPRAPLPPQARAYLRRHDGLQRGSLLRRLGAEVFAVLPRPAPARAPQQPEHQRIIPKIAPP